MKAPVLPPCPAVEELEKLPPAVLALSLQLVEIARAKPYLLDRLKVAAFLRGAA